MFATYIFQKQGVQGFKILYWLSSCDDKDKDNGNDRDEYLQKDKYKYKDTHTQTKTITKCFQDPMYVKYVKS